MIRFAEVSLLACEVVANPKAKYRDGIRGRYEFAPDDSKGRGNLGGNIRVPAAAAMVQTGHAQHIVVYGMIQIARDNVPGAAGVDSAKAIRAMLVHDYGMSPEAVTAHPVDGRNTEGNVYQISQRWWSQRDKRTCVITNAYHYARTQAFMRDQGLAYMHLLPAEAVLLALVRPQHRKAMEAYIRSRLEELDLAGLTFGEMKGAAKWWTEAF